MVFKTTRAKKRQIVLSFRWEMCDSSSVCVLDTWYMGELSFTPSRMGGRLGQDPKRRQVRRSTNWGKSPIAGSSRKWFSSDEKPHELTAHERYLNMVRRQVLCYMLIWTKSGIQKPRTLFSRLLESNLNNINKNYRYLAESTIIKSTSDAQFSWNKQENIFAQRITGKCVPRSLPL